MRNLVPSFIIDKLNSNLTRGNFFGYVVSGDIENFTPMVENLMKKDKEGAEILGNILNRTLGNVTDIIYKNNGFITSFSGDAFTAIFSDEKSFVNVLQVSKQILDIFSNLNRKGGVKLNIRLGISSGNIDWAIFNNERSIYYFRGCGINSAIRIQHGNESSVIKVDKNLIEKIDKNFIKEIKDEYFIVDDQKLEPSKNLNEKIEIIPFKSLNSKFFPEIISDLKIEGEFRKVIPIFINFPFDLDDEKLDLFLKILDENSKNYNAYLNKVEFGDKGGMALLIFGAPYTQEDMVERAILCSTGIFNHLNEKGIKVTIGLDYGTTYSGFIGSTFWQEYTVIGDIVNTSARIATLNKFSVMISERLAGETKRVEFSDETEISLKGKEKKIKVLTVKNITPKKNFDFISPFIERKNVTEKLEKFLKNIDQKRITGIVNISGESGTGKTRISFELFSKLGYEPLYTTADPIIKEPMMSIKNLFANIIGINTFDKEIKRKEILKKFSQDFEKFYEIENERLYSFLLYFFNHDETYLIKNLPAREKLEGTFFTLKNILFKNIKDKKIALIFDDFMWADQETVDFINYLLRDQYEFKGVPFVFLYREENENIRRLKKLGFESIVIKLENFNFENVKTFLQNFFKSEISKELLNTLWQKSEGNPLFLEQLSVHLVNNGLLINKDGMISLKETEYEIPSNIDRLIVSRLDSLSAITRDGVQKASIIGKEFEIILLSFLIEKKHLNKILSEAEKNKIITIISDKTALFRHILLYEITYKMQFKKVVEKLHRRIGELYETLFKENLINYYETLYYHFSKANVKNKAIYYLKKSIEKDISSFSNENAIKLIDQYLQYRIKKDEKILFTIKKAEILSHIGKYKDSIKEYKKILREQNLKSKTKAIVLKGIGNSFWAMGDYKKALSEYKKSLKIVNTLKDNKEIADIYEKIGIVYYNRGDYLKSKEMFNIALKYAKKDIEKRFSIYSNLGLLLYRQGNYEKAMEYYTRSLDYAKKNNNLSDQALFHLRIGLIHYEKQEYDKALKNYFVSLDLNRKTGNRRNEGVTLGNIGTVYNEMGETDKALDYLFKALQIDKEINNLENESIILGNIANIYGSKEDWESSLKYYKEALEVDRKIGSKWSEAIDLGNIGQLFKLQKKYKEADEYFKKCIKIIKEMNARYPLSHFLYHRALLLYEMKNFQLSLKLSKESLKIAKELKKENLVKSCEDLLKKLEEKNVKM
ncbi:MAG: tetratricopeptide repeat protein [candidate division WOR-3 bacterium]